ncbi:transmembrane protein 205 [Diachasma alloeum]|uniref:transmembrane protein 205 n=1 Tax=Diachasma alloeum TaxID=454923 RepID=UPI000738233C|nr:transmembrane protein 205 [Diachasma alloeum]
MCVRTLIPNEVTPDAVTPPPISKFSKAKEKYMKVHDELVQKARESSEVSELELESDDTDSPELTSDILAKSTTIYAKCLEIVMRHLDTWKHSKTCKILFQTTQPAHVIMIAAVLCVISALVPTSDRINSRGQPRARIMSLIYLTSFALHFGAQIWMTFVSGLSLYFALPRHSFGEVQRVLFPRYFTINACLSFTTLLIFAKHHSGRIWESEITVQLAGMTTAFFIELLVRLYLTPPLISLMSQKTLIERAAGVGNEVGKHNPGSLKHCPHYLKLHGAFRKAHMFIAMGNIMTMVCTVLHLHYISSKLCVL